MNQSTIAYYMFRQATTKCSDVLFKSFHLEGLSEIITISKALCVTSKTLMRI